MDFCKHGDESRGHVKCGEFLDHLRNYWLFKKESGVMEFSYLFVI